MRCRVMLRISPPEGHEPRGASPPGRGGSSARERCPPTSARRTRAIHPGPSGVGGTAPSPDGASDRCLGGSLVTDVLGSMTIRSSPRLAHIGTAPPGIAPDIVAQGLELLEDAERDRVV